LGSGWRGELKQKRRGEGNVFDLIVVVFLID
jgi:hypothetical protein